MLCPLNIQKKISMRIFENNLDEKYLAAKLYLHLRPHTALVKASKQVQILKTTSNFTKITYTFEHPQTHSQTFRN